MQSISRSHRRPLVGAMATIAIAGLISAAPVSADPDDSVATLNDLSRQAEQTTEAMHSAQLDLDAKLAAQKAADDKLAADRAAADTAKAQLASYQSTIDQLAA